MPLFASAIPPCDRRNPLPGIGKSPLRAPQRGLRKAKSGPQPKAVVHFQVTAHNAAGESAPATETALTLN